MRAFPNKEESFRHPILYLSYEFIILYRIQKLKNKEKKIENSEKIIIRKEQKLS